MVRPTTAAATDIPAFAPVLRPPSGFSLAVPVGSPGEVFVGRVLIVGEVEDEAEKEVEEEEVEVTEDVESCVLALLLVVEVGNAAADAVLAESENVFAAVAVDSETNVTPTGESGPLPFPFGASTSWA